MKTFNYGDFKWQRMPFEKHTNIAKITATRSDF